MCRITPTTRAITPSDSTRHSHRDEQVLAGQRIPVGVGLLQTLARSW